MVLPNSLVYSITQGASPPAHVIKDPSWAPDNQAGINMLDSLVVRELI